MVKRKSLPWAPNCVPDMRRQWCNALDTLVERQSAALAEPSDASGEGARRLQRLQAKLAESLSQMSAEADAIKSASLFWVSRDMVDVALDAADSLPEWTPAIAAPAQHLALPPRPPVLLCRRLCLCTDTICFD